MGSALATFLVVAGVGVGGYALYRWWEEDKKKGDHWRRREKQNLHDAHVTGYFTGIQSGPAIVGMDYAGNYYYAGQAKPPQPPDPRNCLCPQSLDPLDPTLPVYKCPCNVPGAIRPPYAGYMAVGRGGGGGGGRHYHPQQQQQQQEQQDDGSGMPGDPDAQQPPWPPHHQPHHPQHHPQHHGRR